MILQALHARPAAAEDLAPAMGATLTNVRTVLLRLVRQGAVERVQVQRGRVALDPEGCVTRRRLVFVYRLTRKGSERLAWILTSPPAS